MNSKIQAVKNAVTSKAGIQVLKLKKNSPHLMFGVGVVGVVGTVVLASKATLQLEEVIDEHEDRIVDAKGALGKHLRSGRAYNETDLRNDLVKIHLKTVGQVTKLYGPATLLGVASIGLLTGSHVQLTRRNASVMAAYATVDKAFKTYRQRVVEEIGADKDREFMYGSKDVETETVNKKGEVKKSVVQKAADHSQYARFFNEDNPNWAVVPEHSLFFLKSQQTYANQKLNSNGYLLLNEVYDALGFPRTSDGAVVGWLAQGDGDGFVDFGIWDDDRMEQFHAFLVGHEGDILVDFNVDGLVYDLIDKI